MDRLLRVILGEAIPVREHLRFGQEGSNYDLTFPRCLAALLRGKNAREPWRGASNFRCDMIVNVVEECQVMKKLEDSSPKDKVR